MADATRFLFSYVAFPGDESSLVPIFGAFVQVDGRLPRVALFSLARNATDPANLSAFLKVFAGRQSFCTLPRCRDRLPCLVSVIKIV
jgi:hypothetical protein